MWSGHTEPLRDLRKESERLCTFRPETPLSHFEEIGKNFHEAGIDLNTFNYIFTDHFTNE